MRNCEGGGGEFSPGVTAGVDGGVRLAAVSNVEERLVAANGVSFSAATDALRHGPERVVSDNSALLDLLGGSLGGSSRSSHSAGSGGDHGDEVVEMHFGCWLLIRSE